MHSYNLWTPEFRAHLVKSWAIRLATIDIDVFPITEKNVYSLIDWSDRNFPKIWFQVAPKKIILSVKKSKIIPKILVGQRDATVTDVSWQPLDFLIL